MDGDGVRRSDLEMRGFGEVMDVMQEDDDLIGSSVDGFLDSGNQMGELNFDLSEALGDINLADSAETDVNKEQVAQPCGPLGLDGNNRARRLNLRKSLAWDSAFFTSAGVLDLEELSTMIGGPDYGGRNALPGIQEDDMRSSVSTLDSDALTLESLEAELFQDIRASIQKSSKTLTAVSSSTLPRFGENGKMTLPSHKKTSLSSGNNAMLAKRSLPKRVTASAPVSLKTTKLSCLEVSQNRDGKCKGRSTSRPKLSSTPRKLGAIPPSPTNRVSTNANQAETSNRPTGAVRGAPLVKLPASNKASNALPRPTISKPTVPLSSKETKRELGTLRSSVESSSSNASIISSKSPLNPTTMKNDPKAFKPPTSSSTQRVSSRNTSKASNPPVSKNKAQPQPDNSCLSAYLKSTAVNASSISPASSISEWSVESSSSAFTINQGLNNPCHGAEATPSMKGSIENDDFHASSSPAQSVDSNTGTDEISTTGLVHGTIIPRPAAAKPSGLRMPSPKIGFFDGVKSLSRTPKRIVLSDCGPPSGQHKEGARCSPGGGLGNGKIGRLQTRTSVSLLNRQQNAQPAALDAKSPPNLPVKKSPSGSTKKPGSLKASKKNPTLSPNLKTRTSLRTRGKGQLKAEACVEEHDGKMNDQDSSQNDTTIGELVGAAPMNEVLPVGGNGVEKIHASFTRSSPQEVNEAGKCNSPPKHDLQMPSSCVGVENSTSETQRDMKWCTVANDEGLGVQIDLIMSSGINPVASSLNKLQNAQSAALDVKPSSSLPVKKSPIILTKNHGSFQAANTNPNFVSPNLQKCTSPCLGGKTHSKARASVEELGEKRHDQDSSNNGTKICEGVGTTCLSEVPTVCQDGVEKSQLIVTHSMPQEVEEAGKCNSMQDLHMLSSCDGMENSLSEECNMEQCTKAKYEGLDVQKDLIISCSLSTDVARDNNDHKEQEPINQQWVNKVDKDARNPPNLTEESQDGKRTPLANIEIVHENTSYIDPAETITDVAANKPVSMVPLASLDNEIA